MNFRKLIIASFILSFAFSCAKIDNNRPYISSVKVNGVGTDTIYLVDGTLDIVYLISDDELIVDSKIKFVQNDNLDSGFFFLSIAQVNAKNLTGNEVIVVPDTVKKHSKLFTLTVDAYDNSGNTANQLSKVIHFK